MMKVENLQLVTRNETVEGVLKFLKQEDLYEVNLNVARRQLFAWNVKLHHESYLKFFRDLEAAGAGTFAKDNPSVFISKYSLKDISNQISQPNRLIELHERDSLTKSYAGPTIIPAKRVEPIKPIGRPKGAKNKPRAPQKPIREITTTFSAPEPKSPKLQMMFTKENGEVIKLTMDDIREIVKQAEAIKKLF